MIFLPSYWLTDTRYSRVKMVSASTTSNDRQKQKWYRRRPILLKAYFTDLQNGSYIAAVYSIVSNYKIYNLDNCIFYAFFKNPWLFISNNFAELFFIIQQTEVTTQCKQTQTWSCAMFTSSYIVATKFTISTVMK